MSGFTDGKPRIATEHDIAGKWGGGFWCKLCGHHFAVGDQWRWVHAGGRQCVNFLVCGNCDGDDALDRYEAAMLLANHADGAVVAIERLTTERQRLFDLVRYCRHALHTDGLISNEEYSQILIGGSSGEADGGSVKRLGGYDEVRAAYTAELAAMKQERDELRADNLALLSLAIWTVDGLKAPWGVFQPAKLIVEREKDAARTAQQEGK